MVMTGRTVGAAQQGAAHDDAPAHARADREHRHVMHVTRDPESKLGPACGVGVGEFAFGLSERYLQVAANILRFGKFQSLTDRAGFKWRMLVIAALVAMIGPTAWTISQRFAPRAWVAVLLAVAFTVVLLKIGDDANYEFIYFQF